MLDIYSTCISALCVKENNVIQHFKEKTLFSFFMTSVLSPGIGAGEDIFGTIIEADLYCFVFLCYNFFPLKPKCNTSILLKNVENTQKEKDKDFNYI